MSYASQLPDIVAAYKAELREQERRNWEKWQAFRQRVSLGARPNTKEADNVSPRS